LLWLAANELFNAVCHAFARSLESVFARFHANLA
jgi:hypothetical protein